MVMFQYGKRLSSLNPMTIADLSQAHIIVSEQAQAYLVSLSTLRLLELPNAWFSYSIGIEEAEAYLQVYN